MENFEALSTPRKDLPDLVEAQEKAARVASPPRKDASEEDIDEEECEFLDDSEDEGVDEEESTLLRNVDKSRAKLFVRSYHNLESPLRLTFEENEEISLPETSNPQNSTSDSNDRRDAQSIPKMNICIMVVGTRGDVQPFIALGLRLKDHGHRVRLATHAVYRSFVVAHGLEFYPIGGDPKELSAYMVKVGGHIIPSGYSVLQDVPRNVKMIESIIFSTWPACTSADPDAEGEGMAGEEFIADAIISNPVTYGHIHVAEALSVPLHLMFPQPWVPTRQFPHPMANMAYDKPPSWKNALSYEIVNTIMWEGMIPSINKFRKNVLGLRPIRLGEFGGDLLLRLKVPWTFMWSPAFVPKPVDWGPEVDVAGNFILKEENSAEDWTPPQALLNFLNAGVPPIFVGFGSMVMPNPRKVSENIIKAAEREGVRVLLQSSWTDMTKGIEFPPNIFVLGNAPHSWLMPRMAAVVHHGGAGTTAAGLLAGKPTFICPFFGDQFFWGEMVKRARLGPAPIPIKSLTAEGLSKAFSVLLDPETQRNAEDMSREFREEDGVGNGVASFYRHLPVDNMVCDLDPNKIARVYLPELRLKLSVPSAEILMQYRPETRQFQVQKYRAVNYDRLGMKSTHQGLLRGAGAFSHEISGAVADLAALPTVGFRKDGLKGAMVGVFKATGGLVLRPLKGGALWIDHTATGFRNKHLKKEEEEPYVSTFYRASRGGLRGNKAESIRPRSFWRRYSGGGPYNQRRERLLEAYEAARARKRRRQSHPGYASSSTGGSDPPGKNMCSRGSSADCDLEGFATSRPVRATSAGSEAASDSVNSVGSATLAESTEGANAQKVEEVSLSSLEKEGDSAQLQGGGSVALVETPARSGVRSAEQAAGGSITIRFADADSPSNSPDASPMSQRRTLPNADAGKKTSAFWNSEKEVQRTEKPSASAHADSHGTKPPMPATGQSLKSKSDAGGQSFLDPGSIPFLSLCLMAVGLKEDVLPFICLGRRLQSHGHRVRLATHERFRPLIMRAELEFYPLAGDPLSMQPYMEQVGGHLIPSGHSSTQGDRHTPANVRLIAEIMKSTLPAATEPDPHAFGDNVSGAEFRADAIIANPASFGHVHVAEALGIPLHLVFTQPWTPTNQFPHPLANMPFDRKPSWKNRVSYEVVHSMSVEALHACINSFRQGALGQRRLSIEEMSGASLYQRLAVPTSYLWSPSLVRKPDDWPESVHIVGFPDVFSVEKIVAYHTFSLKAIAKDATGEGAKVEEGSGRGLSSSTSPWVSYLPLHRHSLQHGASTASSDIVYESQSPSMQPRGNPRAEQSPQMMPMESPWLAVRTNMSPDSLVGPEDQASPASVVAVPRKLGTPTSTPSTDNLHSQSSSMSTGSSSFPVGSVEAVEDFMNSQSEVSPPHPIVWISFSNLRVEKSMPVARVLIQSAAEAGFGVILSVLEQWVVAENLLPFPLPENVLVVAMEPTVDLLSRCAGVIHHGSAWETARGLIAGVPALVCPAVGENFFWGEMISRGGLGPSALPFSKISLERTRTALSSLVEDGAYRHRVQDLARALEKEDGPGCAVDAFYRQLPLEDMRCDVDARQVATLWCSWLELKVCQEVWSAISDLPENRGQIPSAYVPVQWEKHWRRARQLQAQEAAEGLSYNVERQQRDHAASSDPSIRSTMSLAGSSSAGSGAFASQRNSIEGGVRYLITAMKGIRLSERGDMTRELSCGRSIPRSRALPREIGNSGTLSAKFGFLATVCQYGQAEKSGPVTLEDIYRGCEGSEREAMLAIPQEEKDAVLRRFDEVMEDHRPLRQSQRLPHEEEMIAGH